MTTRRNRWMQEALKDPTLPAWNRSEYLKVIAHRAVAVAVRDGTLAKPTECSRCWREFPAREIHAHHPDYSRPLDVRWLCQACHHTVHAIANMPNWSRV